MSAIDDAREQVWTCTVLVKDGPEVPWGGDAPPRQAAQAAIAQMLGVEPDAVWSGWGADLTDAQRASLSSGQEYKDGAPVPRRTSSEEDK